MPSLLGESKEIAPERMKRLDQSGKDTQLWMCLVVKAKFSAKKQYCIGTWNVRSLNQGKLDMIKKEMARVNTDILGTLTSF